MKSIYEVPELNVDLFRTNDVLTASDNDVSWDDGWNTVNSNLNL